MFVHAIIRKITMIWLGLLITLSGMIYAPTAAMALDSEGSFITTGSTYYVDCTSNNSGTGTIVNPYNSLSAVNAIVLEPGDSMLFKKGSTCLGQFAPSGSGTEASPIIISAYGSGIESPIINANGQTNAVLLKNMQHVKLSNLELLAPGNNTTARRGVYVFAEDSGDMYGVVLNNLTIHDVRGYMPSTTGGGSTSSTGKFKNASGGIVVEAQGTKTPTAFHDIQILDNKIYSVDRQGIYFWSNWCKRPDLSRWQTDCTANWYPHTNTIIRGNQLSDIGGDGIVPKMTDGGLVENNNLEGFNVRSKSYNAGMWTANSDHITFQYNRATGGISTLDGMAYDIDHATNHIIFQYNLSYNNEGGFFLFCPDGSNTKDFIIRYNISINDRAQLFLQGCGGEISNGKIYNNTMYVGDGLSPTVYAQNGAPIRNVEFFNNIVYKTGTGTVGWGLTDTDFKLDNNVFYGLNSIPNWATDTITADPLLVDPKNNDPRGYRLGEGSQAIGAGVLINSNGGKDYFGNLLSSTEVPNIGAYEGNGVIATPEEECLPSLTVANNTTNGIGRIMATVSNPCTSHYKDLTLSAVGPAGVNISPATKLISTLAPKETVSTEIVVQNSMNKPVDNYSIEVNISNKQGDQLVNSLVNLEVITSSWTSVNQEDFENMTIGESPNGWVTSGNAQPLITTEGDIQALKLIQSSTINKSVWSFPGKAGTVKLVTRVKAGQSNMPLGLHYLDAQDGEVLKLSLNLSGKVSYTNAGTFIDTTTAYKVNEWQTLEAVVDRDTSTYIVFLDGVRVGKGTLGSSTNAISKLRLQVPSGSANGSFLVDQVSISEPDVVVPPVITLALDQSSYNLAVGDTHQLVITEMNNGTETDVTSLSHFELIGKDIASVTEEGLLQGIQEGIATIRVVYQGITAEASIVVSPKNEEGLQTVFSGPSVIKSGEYINVRYGVKKASIPLTAQDINIRYDSNSLQYVDVKSLKEGLSIVDANSDTLGMLRLIIVSKGSEHGVIGDQPELFELQFLAKGAAGDESATIEVTRVVFGDAEGNEYTAQAAKHVITIETAGALGDLNGDGKITIGDLAIIAFHYGKTSSSSDWQLIRVADLNRDGVIGLEDLATLAQKLLK